jgi:phytoene dehydrogenase-like protein
MLSSTEAIVDEYFENERTKVGLWSLTQQLGNPADMYGGGVMLVYMFSVIHAKPYGLCIGGSRMLTEAMADVLRENGGEIVTNNAVVEILLENNRAVGVVTEDGTRVRAKKAVVSNTSHKETLFDLLGEEYFDESLIRKVKGITWDKIALFAPHLALESPPNWKALEKNPDLYKTFGIYFGHDTAEDFKKQFVDIREKTFPRVPGAISLIPTLFDPSQAPPGKHTGFCWQFTSYQFQGDPQLWDEVSKEFGDRLLQQWSDYAPNMAPNSPNILKRVDYTPLDIEREISSMVEGSMVGGNVALDQMGILRPFPQQKPYTTPIKNLYMCGMHNHPVGGVTSGPGYCAANVLAEDFKIKKWWKPYVPAL